MKDTPLYPDMRNSTGKMTIHLMDFGISQILISRVWSGNLADPPPTTSLELPIELLQRYDQLQYPNMGVSENSVPLNPMVNDHYPH